MQVSFNSAADPAGVRLVARIVEQDKLPGDLERAVVEGARAARFTGKAGQVFEHFAERDGEVVRFALAGAGPNGAKDDWGRTAALERAGAALAAKYLTSGEEKIALDASGLDAEAVAAVLTGLRQRAWRHDAYRTRLKDDQKATLDEAVVLAAPKGAEAAWRVEQALAEGVEFTRTLVAEPPNVIYPASFVERCIERFEGTGAEVSFLGEAEMKKLGMGALLGVNQGSAREPRLLVIKWLGGRKGGQPTVFVGKGVTFDTGGISIKPAQGMEGMKWDMGGAGAVVGAMMALAGRRAKANVVGVCGLVENMPDGNAQRPGDVVTTMSGQTVEVINTDAEGRLVLADAITWAQKEFSPKVVIDLATLTGAMVVSLGHEYAGFFSNDEELAADLVKAADTSGDKLWRQPLGEAYDRLINSPIADMKNVGPREAGSITAAQFIKRFVDEGVAWAHLDIAGMAWSNKAKTTYDKGATGYGVRLLDQYIAEHVEG